MVIHHIWNSHVNSTCVPPCLGGPGVRKGQSAGDVCVNGASDTSDVSVRVRTDDLIVAIVKPDDLCKVEGGRVSSLHAIHCILWLEPAVGTPLESDKICTT